MSPKRLLGGAERRKMKPPRTERGDRSGQEINRAKRPRQARSAFAWGDGDGDAADVDSDSDDGHGSVGPEGVSGLRVGTSKERQEVDEAKEAAEAEASETAEEKRLRLARDVLMKLDAEEREKGDDGDTDEEDVEGSGDFIGDRLARARLEATGQLYREIAKGLQGHRIPVSAVRRMRGHKLTPTCVALSPDDCTAFSGSKDNSLVRWDVETGKRVTMLPPWRKLIGGKVPEIKAHSKEILAVAVSGDGRYLASSGRDRLIHVWDCRTDTVVESFRGHQDTVSSLAFRANSLALFSGSHDRCVKHWDLNEMGYVETMFGHQSEINALDTWRKERLVTGGRDRTVRLWKVLEDSHLVFRPVGGGSVDSVKMLNEDWFVTGGEDGNLALWFAMKKKPAVVAVAAHGHGAAGVPRWVTAIGCLKQSDLVVTGSNDGAVRLWRADVEGRSMQQVTSIPLDGFVNGIAVSSTGRFFAVAVGQEHRLGRWEHQRKARNEVCVVPLPSSDDITAIDSRAADAAQNADIDRDEMDEGF